MKTIIACPVIGGDRWVIYHTAHYFGVYVYGPGNRRPVKIAASLN